jgi:hypothetical protein
MRHKSGCPILATHLFLSLGWDTTNSHHPGNSLNRPTMLGAPGPDFRTWDTSQTESTEIAQ